MNFWLKIAINILQTVIPLVGFYISFGKGKRGALKQSTKHFRHNRKVLYSSIGVSLLLSLAVTYLDDRAKDEESQKLESRNSELIKQTSDLKSQLGKVQEQNDGLQKGIAVLSDKSSDMLSEQRNSFVSVFDEQNKLNLKTEGKINSATDLLNLGITKTISRQKDLLAQQQTTLNNLTGSNSYCFLLPAPIDENTVLVSIYNPGQYPLYDVMMEIRDTDAINKLNSSGATLTLDYIQANTRQYPIITLPGSSARMLDRLSLAGLESRKLHLTFFTRYKIFTQDLAFVKLNGVWQIAYRVFETSAMVNNRKHQPKLIDQQVDKDFPRNTKGEVDW